MLLPIFPYKQFCLILNSLRQNCDWREIIWDMAIRPVLKFARWQRQGKRGENKTRRIFPRLAVYITCNTIYFHNYGEYSKAVSQSLHGIDTAVMNMNQHCDDFCFLSLPPFVIFQAQSVNFALYTIIWTAVSDTDLLPIQTTH